MLSEFILFGWASTKSEVQKNPQPYWSFRDEIAIRDGSAMKGRIVISAVIQDKALNQLDLNHICNDSI